MARPGGWTLGSASPFQLVALVVLGLITCIVVAETWMYVRTTSYRRDSSKDTHERLQVVERVLQQQQKQHDTQGALEALGKDVHELREELTAGAEEARRQRQTVGNLLWSIRNAITGARGEEEGQEGQEGSGQRPPATECPMFTPSTSFDLVYCWVNYSDPHWRQVMIDLGLDEVQSVDLGSWSGRRGMDSFPELRYVLRSLHKFGLSDRVDTIHIVHSPLHPPPWYLNTTHPKIKVWTHNDLFPNPAHLPTGNRNAIMANIHHIPNLQNFFIASDDDTLLRRPLRPSDVLDLETGRIKYPLDGNPAPEAQDGWRGAGAHTLDLFRRTWGRRREERYQDNLHAPFLGSRCLLDEIEELWGDEFERTSAHTVQDKSDLQWQTLMANLAIEQGLGTRMDSGFNTYAVEYHTNCSPDVCPETGDSESLQRLLGGLFHNPSSPWINLQGPGFSDEYPVSPHQVEFRAIADRFYQWAFPDPSPFEVVM